MNPHTGQNSDTALPELHQGVLNSSQLEQLLRDIESCTDLQEIVPKWLSQEQVKTHRSLSLAEARALLVDRAVRAVQFRYRYQGADWWDTILVLGADYKVVRIRHDFQG
jgi:hypothetical protein